MKYEVRIRAISEGSITVEADSRETAEAAVMDALFSEAVCWESTDLEFPSIAEQKA